MTASELEKMGDDQLTAMMAMNVMGWYDRQVDSDPPDVTSQWWWRQASPDCRRVICNKNQWLPLSNRNDTSDVVATIISRSLLVQHRFLMLLRELWLGITTEPINDSIPCSDVLTLFMVPPKMICIAAILAVGEEQK